MLNHKGFDLWADGYDKSVGLSDEDGTYPFAGYKAVLGEIYNRVLQSGAKRILDIGFGTGTLTAKLYEQGCKIYGQDFSERMIALARVKMPGASLVQGDFSLGLAEPLTGQTYDGIIATYSLHHLTDVQKVDFLKSLQPLLNRGGCIYIGDVAFETRAELERCMEEAGELWDDEEIYWVYDEMKPHFPAMKFEKMSHCAGLISLQDTNGEPTERVVIRPIRQGDDFAMAKIVRDNLKKYHLDIPGTAYFDPQLGHLSGYYSEPVNKRAYFVAKTEDGTVVGGIGMEVFSGFPCCGEIQKLYVSDEMKGQGLGGRLLERIEDYAKEHGIERLYLETHSNLKPAVSFYEKQGYHRIERPENVVHSTMDLFYMKELA